MGVKDLWKLLEPAGQPVNLDSLQGMVLAVDVSIWLNQAVKGMRDRHGDPVPQAHLVVLFNRVCRLLHYKIKPVFVFDGATPALKKQTLAERSRKRVRANQRSVRAVDKQVTKFLQSKILEQVYGQIGGPTPQLPQPTGDLFQLPPLPENALKKSPEPPPPLSHSANAEHARQVTSLDIHSQDFDCLPPEVQHELLLERQQLETHTHHDPDTLPQVASDFSSYQLSKLMNQSHTTRKLEEVRQVLKSSETAAMGLNDEARVHDVETNRILSSADAHYILVRGRDVDSQSSGDEGREGQQDQHEHSGSKQEKEEKSKYWYKDEWSSDNEDTEIMEMDNEEENNELLETVVDISLHKTDKHNDIPLQEEMVSIRPEKRTDTGVSEDDEGGVVITPSEAFCDTVSSSPQLADRSEPTAVEKTVNEHQAALSDSSPPQVDPSTAPVLEMAFKNTPPRDTQILETSELLIDNITQSMKSTTSQSSQVETEPQSTSSPQTEPLEKSYEQLRNAQPQPTEKHPETYPVSEMSSSEDEWGDGLLTLGPSEAQYQLRKEVRDLEKERGRQNRAAAAVSNTMYKEAQELFQLFGLPHMVAPSEAEAQCAYLETSGQVAGILTDDNDAFLFGGKTVYRGFFSQDREPQVYSSSLIQERLGLSRDKLVVLAYLLGCDYTPGLEGVGIVSAMELLRDFPGQKLVPLEKIRDWHRDALLKPALVKQASGVLKKLSRSQLPANFPEPAVYQAYWVPEVDCSAEEFEWGKPDLDLLRKFAHDKIQWNQAKVDSLLLPLLKRINSEQKTITHFLTKPLPQQELQGKKIKSKRIRNAVAQLTHQEPAGGSKRKHSQSPKASKKPRITRQRKPTCDTNQLSQAPTCISISASSSDSD